MAKSKRNIPNFLFNYFLPPEKRAEVAGFGELARAPAPLPIRNVSDESPYKIKCREFAEIIGKLGECFLRVFSVNYVGIRVSMP